MALQEKVDMSIDDTSTGFQQDTLHEVNTSNAQDDQALIKELIEKEAKLNTLEHEQKHYDKQIGHIKRSNSWKLMRPVRRFIDWLLRLVGREHVQEQKHVIQNLETMVTDLQEELYRLRAELRHRILDDRLLDSQTMMQTLRDAKQDGELVNFLNDAIKDKKQHEKQYRDALVYAARLFMNDKPEQKHVVYETILSALKTEDMPEFMMRPDIETASVSLQPVASFRASLHMRMRQKQLTKQLPEFTLEDKIDVVQFIDPLNIRKPHVFGRHLPLDAISEHEDVVIKPVTGAGSRGVYLVHDSHDIIGIHQGTNIHNWEQLTENMQTDLKQGLVETDNWLIEELIMEDKIEKTPASDIKFYCFYGRVGLILEITRYPERKHCWWTVDGERIRTGKYDEALFKGQGVSQDDLDMVTNLSLEIPAPFIRIDFLRSNDGLVFGEFTAKPGNYDEFNEETDQMLGDYYLEAEARLTEDLLAGKEFEQFKQYQSFLEDLNTSKA